MTGAGPAGAARQKGAECIRVVARHDRAAAGQHPHEMRVAVIDDMKQIEIGGAPCQPPRIIPQPSGEPVAQMRAGASANKRQPAPSAHQWRAQPGRGDRLRCDRRQALDQHVRDQVHAVPSFLAEIADDADANRFH